ncbi:class I SAM-dependent methyltransferase [Flavobacterium gelidilacus]|uniref:class I SAM-dependent methyltransferase n=1 Tax=Flavobacterium gelidilacus TaxID=206041 RepID=UPI000401ED6D|nr:class I SAM-dependent methyltransferase [Flavobacterium gelidilacus]
MIKSLLLKINLIKYYYKGKYIHRDPIYIKGRDINNDPYYIKGKEVLNDTEFIKVQELAKKEELKKPLRTEIINFLLSKNNDNYLEIGVRNPNDNFNQIIAKNKYSVDPGVEFKTNPVDFKMTSDVFFQKLTNNDILNNEIKFDVIFIDGLHLADQVDRDILNALKFIKDDGFIVLHDCSPPSEWHAREDFKYSHTPACGAWNGTTWKAFLKWRFNPDVNSCCIDSDWGVGIISKKQEIGKKIEAENTFFEFNMLDKNRKKFLNLISFESFKNLTFK